MVLGQRLDGGMTSSPLRTTHEVPAFFTRAVWRRARPVPIFKAWRTKTKSICKTCTHRRISSGSWNWNDTGVQF